MRPVRDADLSPLLVQWSRKVQLYLYSPMGQKTCKQTQCLYKSALYLTFICLQTDGETDIALRTGRVKASAMQDNE